MQDWANERFYGETPHETERKNALIHGSLRTIQQILDKEWANEK